MGNLFHKTIPATLLPQDDDKNEHRRKLIDEQRNLYKFHVRSPGQPAQIKTVPKKEKFSWFYLLGIIWLALKLEVSKWWKILTGSKWYSVNEMKTMFDWTLFNRPADYDRWDSDRKFGLQRLEGVNNLSIRLCTSIPDKLGVTADMVEPFLEDLTLDNALAKKKIYIVDHEILKDCPTNSNTFVCAPIALFYQHESGMLTPIAIQLSQTKGAVNPVFLPSDDQCTWILAKMWFNNADAQVHQSVTHLACTHLFMEGIPIITHRNLSEVHPLFKLLAPHFLYLIAINDFAKYHLLEPHGFFDETMAVGVEGGFELIKRKKSIWRLDVGGTLPNDLKNRGLDDPSCLPDYHFREDALALYDVIKRYVTAYVGLYYVTDSDLQYDWEVQDWRKEMVQPCEEGGMGLQGVPGEDDKFTNKDQLILTLTSIIYTCSVGHAGVNFAMYEEYSFMPNYPSILLGKPPHDKHARTMQDIMACMPDKRKIYDQLIISSILSRRDTESLGYFEVEYITDPKALEVLYEFREELKKIGKDIKMRNENRIHPYRILDPANVPNAISI